MPKIKISDVEKLTGYKVKTNSKSLGIDLATVTGVALLKSDKTHIDLEYSILNFSKNKGLKYEQVVDFFKLIIQNNMKVIIEDTHLQINPYVALFLSRLGGLPLCLCILKKDEGVTYNIIGATSARSKIGINTKQIPKGQSKAYIINWLNENLSLNLKNDNEADATILGLLGLLEDLDFRSKSDIKNNKKKSIKRK